MCSAKPPWIANTPTVKSMAGVGARGAARRAAAGNCGDGYHRKCGDGIDGPRPGTVLALRIRRSQSQHAEDRRSGRLEIDVTKLHRYETRDLGWQHDAERVRAFDDHAVPSVQIADDGAVDDGRVRDIHHRQAVTYVARLRGQHDRMQSALDKSEADLLVQHADGVAVGV